MVVGITGGPASGKSAVTRMLRDRGAVTFSADEASRAVLTPGGPLLRALGAEFGQKALNPDGTLNRADVGRLVFADADARERLNRILHPAILGLLRAQIDAAREDFPDRIPIVVEAPLLFEANLARWFERIIVVIASETTQIARLRARNALNETEARARLESQWPIAEKAARADYTISNEGSLTDLERSVGRIWDDLTRTGLVGAGVQCGGK